MLPWISTRRAEKRSAFRLSPKPGILPSCRIIVAIGFQVGHSSSQRTSLNARSDLLVTQIDALRDAVRQVRARAPFHIDAWVVLPDHMHCLWTLPEGDVDFPGRWRAIKKGFSKSVRIGEPRSPVMIRRGERGIWQQRYWEHTIRDDRDLAVHLDYIHFNPVKHDLVEHPAEWPHSFFRRCVAGGLYPAG
jgi:putative transposase